MTSPRPYTKEEVRKIFLDEIRLIVQQANKREFKEQATEQVAFSVLCLLDGVNGTLPPVYLSLETHPDMKEENAAEGNNWFPEDGEPINGNVYMHDEFYK